MEFFFNIKQLRNIYGSLHFHTENYDSQHMHEIRLSIFDQLDLDKTSKGKPVFREIFVFLGKISQKIQQYLSQYFFSKYMSNFNPKNLCTSCKLSISISVHVQLTHANCFSNFSHANCFNNFSISVHCNSSTSKFVPCMVC